MSQSQHIPPRRTRRPRLRVKTGCLTCLDRHKKCDETRPCCQACARLGLECVWRASATGHAQPDQHPPTRRGEPSEPPGTVPISFDSSTSPSKALAGHSGFRSVNDQSMFTYFVSYFAPMLCDGRSHPFYRDSSHCLSLALQVPWLMDTILAVAEHHYALSQDGCSTSALHRYGQAVRGLREQIGSMTFPEDPLLCAVTFAGVFEERLSDRQGSSTMHFQSSWNFLRTLVPSLEASRGSKSRMAFLRQQADMTIYYVATRAIFQPGVQNPSTRRNLEDLDAYYQKLHPGPQDIDPFPSSSFLGPVPGLYMLVYNISSLVRKAPLGMMDMDKAQGYLEKVNDIKALLDATSFLHFAGQDIVNPFLAEDCTPRLYILALEVLLRKIMRPNIGSSNADIQSRVHEAHQLLSRPSFVWSHGHVAHKDMSYHLAEPVCWPTLVIGVAALRPEHRATFERVLGELWKVSYSGFVRRISTILKRAWEMNDRNMVSSQVAVSTVVENECGGSYDGLGMLIRPNGITCLYSDD